MLYAPTELWTMNYETMDQPHMRWSTTIWVLLESLLDIKGGTWYTGYHWTGSFRCNRNVASKPDNALAKMINLSKGSKRRMLNQLASAAVVSADVLAFCTIKNQFNFPARGSSPFYFLESHVVGSLEMLKDDLSDDSARKLDCKNQPWVRIISVLDVRQGSAHRNFIRLGENGRPSNCWRQPMCSPNRWTNVPSMPLPTISSRKSAHYPTSQTPGSKDMERASWNRFWQEDDEYYEAGNEAVL